MYYLSSRSYSVRLSPRRPHSGGKGINSLSRPTSYLDGDPTHTRLTTCLTITRSKCHADAVSTTIGPSRSLNPFALLTPSCRTCPQHHAAPRDLDVGALALTLANIPQHQSPVSNLDGVPPGDISSHITHQSTTHADRHPNHSTTHAPPSAALPPRVSPHPSIPISPKLPTPIRTTHHASPRH